MSDQLGEETIDLRIYLSDLYIQLGKYQNAARILATLDVFSFRSILEIVKLALAKNDTVTALSYCDKLKKVSNTTDEKARATVLKCKCLLLRRETTMALSILKSSVTQFESDEPSSEIIGQFFGILSECHLAVGQYCTARKWAKKELKIATSIGSTNLEADALRNLSNIYQAVDDYRNAIILWYKYHSIILNQSVESRLSSLHQLAELCRKCDRFEEAEKSLLQRLELCRKTGALGLIISAHADMYQFYRVLHNEEEAQKHWKEAHKMFTEHGTLEQQALIIEMVGDCNFDDGSFEEAIEAYDQCLMLVQEDGDLQKEAELCIKLGASHWSLYHADEALAYYQQSLAVCQQTSDLECMLKLYNLMANIHFRKGAMEECHSCLRCYLTLASLLSKKGARLDALIFIGRTLLIRERYKEARKIFIKAQSLTKGKEHRRERGLIYGYIAECYIGLGDRTKAALNFCKQIAFFDDIDDIEGKCETLRHLIEVKRLSKDANWAMRLCKRRVIVAQMGTVDLQVEVLKESAEIATNLSEPREALKFLEKAVILCISNKCSNILDLLLNLKEKYLKLGAGKRAIMLFRECLNAIGINPSKRILIMFELGKLELEEGSISNAIAYIMEAREKCLDKSMKGSIEYTLACAYYANKNYGDALYHLQNFNNLQNNLSQICTDKIELELAVIEWHHTASDHAIETIQNIAIKDNLAMIHRFLDESCLYDLLNQEKLSRIAAIHWMMTRGNFMTAKNLFILHKNAYQNSLEYAIDLALLYWYDQNLTECDEFLENYLRNYVAEERDETTEEQSIIRFHCHQQTMLNFLCTILILCKYAMHADAMETVTVAEIKFWKNYQGRKQFLLDYSSIPNPQFTQQYFRKQEKNVLYCFHMDNHVLIWHFNNGRNEKFYYFIDITGTNFLPIFYAQFLHQMFATVGIDNCTINNGEFQKLIDDSEILVNVRNGGASIVKTHLVALHEPKPNRERKKPEIGILCAGIDPTIIPWEHVTCNDETDFICKAQASSLIIIDITNFPIQIDNAFNCDLCVDIVILLNSETDNLANHFRIVGTPCLLDIKHQTFQSLSTFLEKLISGCSVDECSEFLEAIDVRLFGNRSSKVCFGVAQRTRKAIVEAEQGLVDDGIVGDDYKELENFRGLPTEMRFHLLDLLSRQPNTNDVAIFVEKLEDIYEQGNNLQFVMSYDNFDDLQHSFAGMTIHEKNSILQFVKRIFRDHLYDIFNDTSTVKLDVDLDELMQSLATKVRATRRNQRRRKCKSRGFNSEGECSRRSSMSENTDSEAVVIDVEFQDSV